jgi:hypothetical protein
MEINTSPILSIYDETLYVDNLHQQQITLEGSYLKSILVFKNLKDNTPESQQLLQNMLQACQITPSDCYTAFIENPSDTLQLIQQYSPKIILSFGVYIANEVFKLPPRIHKIQQLLGADVIIAMPLHSMINDANAKKELWAALQIIFDIKSTK